jgi:hypothetical protein
MKKYYFLTIFFLISNHTFACDLKFNDNINNVMSTWLGNNSEFSKVYKIGKCALDKALNELPASQRRVIANLIAKSYNFTETKSNTEKLLTYNY